MKKLILILAVAVTLTACTRPDAARRVLEQNNYSQIEITGYRFFMSSREEMYSTGFRAISPSGEPISGAVTSGFFGGQTIRLD